MDTINGSSRHIEANEKAEARKHMVGLSRRAMLKSATIAAGTVAGVSAALSQTVPAAAFGAPVVELYVPAGLLSLEQKSAMINGVTDVVAGAVKLPPDQARKLFVQIFE